MSDRPAANRLYTNQLNTQNIDTIIGARLELLAAIYPDFLNCQRSLGITTNLLEPLWQVWLPLALENRPGKAKMRSPLYSRHPRRPGTGKTTLCKFLTLILTHLGYGCLSISIDDLYKTYADRQKLRQQDPRLIWRGPPGTHDVELGIELLDQLRAGNKSSDRNQANQTQQYISIPKFDKAAYGGRAIALSHCKSISSKTRST
jgi:D-glycerate 3-kinase